MLSIIFCCQGLSLRNYKKCDKIYLISKRFSAITNSYHVLHDVGPFLETAIKCFKKAPGAPAARQKLLLHIFTPEELAKCSVKGESYKTKNGE